MAHIVAFARRLDELAPSGAYTHYVDRLLNTADFRESLVDAVLAGIFSSYPNASLLFSTRNFSGGETARQLRNDSGR